MQAPDVLSVNLIAQAPVPPPASWKEYIVKWGVPLISLTGYAGSIMVALTLPASVISEERSITIDRLKIVGQGATIVGGAILLATVTKVIEAAGTACFRGWKEGKKKFTDAMRYDGFIRNTMLPFSEMRFLVEGLDISRRQQIARRAAQADIAEV